MGDDKPPLIYCPSCGKVAIESHSAFGVRHDCLDCELWSYGGKPLTDKATHSARIRAHNAFDPLWKRTGQPQPQPIMTRSEAYAELARVLHMQREDCHFGQMSLKHLILVPEAVKLVRANYVVKDQPKPAQKARQKN